MIPFGTTVSIFAVGISIGSLNLVGKANIIPTLNEEMI